MTLIEVQEVNLLFNLETEITGKIYRQIRISKNLSEITDRIILKNHIDIQDKMEVIKEQIESQANEQQEKNY